MYVGEYPCMFGSDEIWNTEKISPRVNRINADGLRRELYSENIKITERMDIR